MHNERQPKHIQEACEIVKTMGFDTEYPEAIDAVNAFLIKDEYLPFTVELKKTEVSHILHRLSLFRDFYIDMGHRSPLVDGRFDLEEDCLSVLISQFTNAILNSKEVIPLRTDLKSVNYLDDLMRSKEVGHSSTKEKFKLFNSISKLKSKSNKAVQQKRSSGF